VRNDPSRSVDRFVDAVYRRWLIVHLFEQLGRGLLVGSLLALGLLPVAIWQAIPTVPILIFSAVFSLFLGLILALYRKPNRLAAAVEADRQLHLDDLLTSAIFPSDHADTDFRTMVQSIADARCSRHSPSEVLLRRFGIRSWSGIALAMCIAATLAVIPLQPSRTQAVDANVSVLSESPSGLTPSSRADRVMVSVVNDPMSDGASSGSMTTEKPRTRAAGDGQPTESSGTKAAGNTAGTGGGNAQSNSAPTHDLPSGQSPGRSTSPAGIAAGGGATSNQQGAQGDSSNGVAGASTKSPHAVPGWTGGATPNSQNSGESTNDRIPPEDRDLVRDFFRK
jgi:hypothetical protein